MKESRLLELSENKVVFTRKISRRNGRNKDILTISIPTTLNLLFTHKSLVKVTVEKL